MAGVKHLDISRTLHWLRQLAGYFFLSLAALSVAQAEPKFKDPLDTPAKLRTALDKRPLMAIVHAGARLVAVGSRGLIIVSDDQGKNWTQVNVPVQSDLLAVNFPTASEGWAVGHDGVVLHTADGGKTWAKQLDWRLAGASFKAFYAAMGSQGEAALHQVEANYKVSAALPLLDVWFEDILTGFAVGSYGQIIATTDGGKTWQPWLHRIDNSQSLNLNAIHRVSSDLFIVGERGQVYRLDRVRGYFARADTGYNGSFFGIAGIGETLLAYGLRGTLYRSDDGGKHWESITGPSEQTISAGIALPDNNGFVLVNSGGQFLMADKTGKNIHLLPESRPMRMTGIVATGAGRFVVTGIEGIGTENLNVAATAIR